MNYERALRYFKSLYIALARREEFIDANYIYSKYLRDIQSAEHNLERKLVLTHYKEGMNEVIAYKAMNRKTRELELPKNYGYILYLYKDQYTELINNWKKAVDDYYYATRNYVRGHLSIIKFCETMVELLKNNGKYNIYDYEKYIKVKDQYAKVEDILNNKINDICFYAHENYKEYENSRKLLDYLNKLDEDYYKPIYKDFIYSISVTAMKKKEILEFILAFDQTYLTLNPSITAEKVERGWNYYGFVKRDFTKYPLNRTKIPGAKEFIDGSSNSSTKTTTTTTKVASKSTTKKTTTTKVSSSLAQSSSKTSTSTKAVPKTTNITAEPQQKVVEAPKPIVNNDIKDEVNVLEISEYTKVGKFYKINKVKDVAKKIIIDDSVFEIARFAFRGCFKMQEVTLSKNLKVLEFGVFSNLPALQKVNFVEGLEEIKQNVFDNSDLRGSYKLPTSLKKVGTLAFQVRVPNYLEISVPQGIEYEKTSFHPVIKLSFYEVKKTKTTTSKTTKTTKITAEPQQKIVEAPKPSVVETKPLVEIKPVTKGFYSLELHHVDGEGVVATDVKTLFESYYIHKFTSSLNFKEQSKFGDNIKYVKKIVLPKELKVLHPGTFLMFKGLETLTFPKVSMITVFPKHMIGDCLVKEIYVPDSVYLIDKECFTLCKNLKKVSINACLDPKAINVPKGCKIVVRK